MAVDFYKLLITSSWFGVYLLAFLAILTTKLQTNASDPEENKINVKYNDFNGSVRLSTINGRVFVNCSTSLGPWNSTAEHVKITVYFLHNYMGNGNLSSKGNISVCSASLMKHNKNKSWKTQSLNGYLLNYCKESQLCGPFNENLTALVKSNWIAESNQFSCQLFTACSSFDGNYGIQIVAVTDNRRYIYHIENLSIPSQNMPPTLRNIRSNFSPSLSQVSLLWDYFHPSQLCGFGLNISTEIMFVIRYYMSNKSKCYYMGERTFNFDEQHAKFTNISRMDTKYMFYLFAKFLKNGQTSKPWEKKILAEEEMDKPCLVQGGVVQVSLQPDWNCMGKDIIEQVEFCFNDNFNNFCVVVCEAFIFRNGTVAQITSFSGNFISFCHQHSEYFEIHSNNTDMVDALWDSSSRKMKCSIFIQCITYLSTIYIHRVTLDIPSRRVLKTNQVCVCSVHDNQPSSPRNLQLIAWEQYSVTFSWEYGKCEANYFNVQFRIFQNDRFIDSISNLSVGKEEGSRLVYTYTSERFVVPFTHYQFRVDALNDLNDNSASSTLLNVQTKEGAPSDPPSITQIIKQAGGHSMKITWQLPKEEKRHGVINESVIEVIGLNKSVLNRVTIYGENITSAVINITDSEICDYFRLKVCNAASLCSPYTNTKKFENPCGKGKPIVVRRTTNVNKTIIITIFVAVILLLIVFAVAIWYFRKRRRSCRTRLPILTTIQESCDTGDYMPIGQTSLPNEYHRLNESLSDVSS